MSQSALFRKILVANRGEIACRVFRSAKKMGIGSVAIYSDADARALHVSEADEAVAIGGTTAAESYLDIDKVIEACKQTGADAVHPGYGFLSEQPAFAERLAKEGISFIGPDTKAIELMGDKITSKKLSADAGVSTVPGYMGIIDTPEQCIDIANDIGYPVMIKASAGGGGKGMRIAWNMEEVADGFARSKSEALSSFGDDRIFVEKFITNPRHIEIQVLADKHGNCVYLAERECSIQRRNQKVVEEAPSPFLDETTRKAMGEQAVSLSKAVDYCSAGTVEFIVDEQRNFYFLEMNTRLQVEHPVTELITGVDLVEQMIRVAAGEKLTLSQDEIKLDGWAVESRLYAEDPVRNFLPSIGRLTEYKPPESGDALDGAIVRCDSGVAEGGEISMYYDPMIAKLCTWAPTRDRAIDAMSDALDGFRLQGVGNNLQFLSSIMHHPRFKAGNLSTAFIDEEYPEGFSEPELTPALHGKFAAVAVMLHAQQKERLREHEAVLTGQLTSATPQPVVCIGRHCTEVEIDKAGEVLSVKLDSQEVVRISNTRSVSAVREFVIDDKPHLFQVKAIAEGFDLLHAGCRATVRVLSARKAALVALMPEIQAEDTSRYLLCPMPGLVVALHVSEGDRVEVGQPLAIVEAMKMENVLSAAKTGVVASIPVETGQSLSVDDVIMEFADE